MALKTNKRKPVKKPIRKKPSRKSPAKLAGAKPGQTLYEQRRRIHCQCPRNYQGSECYIANQTECSQFRILQETHARGPGDPSRW